jgi:hypothetical protein
MKKSHRSRTNNLTSKYKIVKKKYKFIKKIKEKKHEVIIVNSIKRKE